MTVDPAALLALATDLATEGAALAVRMRAEGVEVSSKSTPVDVVTAADKAVEARIRERLAVERPGDGFYGEESDPAASGTGLTWVVDPIDGTVNFLYGIPQWACSVAVVEGGVDPASWRILAGAVVNAAAGEAWTASLGGGAALNGEPIRTSSPGSLAMSLVGTGFSYHQEQREAQGAAVHALLPRVRDIRRLGACSLDLCGVAAGRLDAYAERGVKQWDFAAAALVATEAGAVVTATDVAADGRRIVTAAAPTIAAEFAAAVAEVGL